MGNISNIGLQAKFCNIPHVSGQYHKKCHGHVPARIPELQRRSYIYNHKRESEYQMWAVQAKNVLPIELEI